MSSFPSALKSPTAGNPSVEPNVTLIVVPPGGSELLTRMTPLLA